MFVVILLIIGLIFWWCQTQRVKETEFLKKLPEPTTTLPILGLALDFLSTKDILGVLLKYVKSCGSIVKTKIGPFRTFLLVTDYNLTKQVLSSSTLLTKSDNYRYLDSWLGAGLLTSDGEIWKKHRRILTPTFHVRILEEFIQVFENCGDILIEKLQEFNEKSFDVYPLITLCSLDIICESIMGIKLNSQINGAQDYPESVQTMCSIIIERSISVIGTYDFSFKFTNNYRKQRQALKILHKKSKQVIETRLQELNKNNGRDRKPFLDLLLQANTDNQQLTQEEIREEVDTFMFAGHDTTASALSFLLYCLANNSRVQNKVLEEQQEILKTKKTQKITYSDLQNMKYLECVIKETLRLYPSVPFYGRQVMEDFNFDNNVIPKGVTIGIFAFGIHRNPEFYKNPEQFQPERFEDSNNESPFSFIPFSAGPRNCIGQKFAMLELKTLVSKILKTYELLPVDHKLQLIAETTLKSANGIVISLKPRV